MSYIDSKSGRHLMIVDPETGVQIPHVVGCSTGPDPEDVEVQEAGPDPESDPDGWNDYEYQEPVAGQVQARSGGWLEVMAPQPCGLGPGMNMQIMVNGQFEERNYTFMRAVDPVTGQREFLKTTVHCAFDVVNKDTGEVYFEVAGEQAPLRFRDPEQWAREYQQQPGFARIGVPEPEPASTAVEPGPEVRP